MGSNDVDFKANDRNVLYSGGSTDVNFYQVNFTTTTPASSSSVYPQAKQTNNNGIAVSVARDATYLALGINYASGKAGSPNV